MLNKAMFSSAKSEWETPEWLFKPLANAYDITWDVCATAATAKTPGYWSPEEDAFKKQWKSKDGAFYMNPPYGKQIERWVNEAWLAAQTHGSVVVCLLPARTDTRWWWDFCWQAERLWIKGRVKFLSEGKEITSAPFPSVVVVFHRDSSLWGDYPVIDAGKRVVKVRELAKLREHRITEVFRYEMR